MTTTKTRQARRKQAIKQITAKMKQQTIAPRKKKSTPFSDVGSIIGGGVGKMFGFPYAQGIGKWLGSGIGSIFGSGDYEMVGEHPSYNVLTNGAQIPKFSTTRQTNIVSHREYLGDIVGTAGFSNRKYPINPGNATTFPWLSSIAQNYQQYRIHGLIFEFRPLITDFVTSGAPGVVIMATNYNADEPLYTTKQQMENSEYAVSVKPTLNLIHGVECALGQTVLSELYVRNAALATNLDLKFTDLGNFQFATQANPVQTLGELWCSYTIEFFKPILPKEVGAGIQSSIVYQNNASSLNPFGTTRISLTGDLEGFALAGSQISFIGQPGNEYFIMFNWVGNSTAGAVSYPSIAVTNLVFVPAFKNQTDNDDEGPANGDAAREIIYTGVLRCTSTTGPIICTIVASGGTYPLGTVTFEGLITQVSDSLVTS
jgi:hypothetical protein